MWQQGYRNAGVVLQSCLPRSEADAARMNALGARVRLVKGAYKEPREIAYQAKADVDAAFVRIMRLLLSAHPQGIIAGDIGAELDIPPSTLSHHLDKLRNEDLVNVRRESTFLWYSANTEALQELLGFLYAECCTRNKAIEPKAIVQLCK